MGVGPGLLGLREGGGRGQSSRLLAFLATPPPQGRASRIQPLFNGSAPRPHPTLEVERSPERVTGRDRQKQHGNGNALCREGGGCDRGRARHRSRDRESLR